MIVHWHPDGQIYLRNDDWTVVYEGTAAEIAEIIGEPLEALPAGVIERQLFVGKFCRDFTRSGQAENLVDSWPAGEKIHAKREICRQAQAVKHEKRRVAADAMAADARDQAARDAAKPKPNGP